MSSSKIDSRIKRGARRGGGARFVVLGALLAGLLLWATPALALSQRGHVFSATFGGAGSGEGQFSNPSGVAVNESSGGEQSGDVYVVDRGNNRVEQFGPEGKFLSAWGWGVKDGKEESEVCKAGEGCQAGTPGSGKGAAKLKLGEDQLIAPEGIAVDNSTSAEDPSKGDVYVVADVVPTKSFVYKFSATGAFLGRVTSGAETKVKEFGAVEGVAVDPKGVLWIDWSGGEIVNFTDGEPNKRVNKEEEAFSGVEPLRPGLAVDSQDNLYATYEPSERFEDAEEGKNSEEGRNENGEEPCEASPCFAAKLAGLEEPLQGLGAGEKLIGRVDPENTRGVATDQTNNDSYLDNVTSIAAFTPGGQLIQRFGSGHLIRGAGLAVNASSGNVYVADAGASDVAVFALEGAGPPAISGLSASKITASSAVLNAQVDPTGSRTTDTFEYGTSSCAGGSCTSAAVPGDVGEGFADEPVSLPVGDLAASTTYFFRLVAHNGLGTLTSEEGTFTTQAASEAVSLADQRQWELVSPPTKNGAGLESLTQEGGAIQASEDGSKITYVATAPDEAHPEGNRAAEFTQILSRRVANGEGHKEWSSQDISPPNGLATGLNPGKAPAYNYFSSDLSLSIVKPNGAEPALSPEASEHTVYRRNDEGCQPPPSTCYRPLVTGKEGFANVSPGTKFGSGKSGEGIQFVDGTPDLSHAIVSSEEPLLAGALDNSLYEWAGGGLQLVNILPESQGVAENVSLGSQSSNVWNALSSNGSRVVWTTGTSGGEAIYVRDTVRGETIRVDSPLGGSEASGAGATFQTASPDGSRIFFTDSERLTPESKASSFAQDLYSCEVVETAGKLACNLEDLTEHASNSGEEGGGVQGVVLGASEQPGEEGTTVYFVANEVLSTTPNAGGESASAGGCEEVEEASQATCNVYADHYIAAENRWQPTFVASLSAADEPDWGTGPAANLAGHTSRVSPNGLYVAFMSSRRLKTGAGPGYDNRDVNSGEPDEEVFIFDSQSGSLTCASCNPSGARPTGVLDKLESGEGLGLLIDRSENWSTQLAAPDHWLSGDIPGWTALSVSKSLYQSRYLSDEGRLFFNSSESLVPADVNGKEDVYEYEPQGGGGCGQASCVALISSGSSTHESAFLDASTSGDDAFFLTASPLVAADQDSLFDVYDARVCNQGSESSCISSTTSTSSSCSTPETCKSGGSSLPTLGTPASTTSSGNGNLPPQSAVLPSVTKKAPAKLTRAQRLKKALKACHKLKKKKARAACEKAAHKKWGAKKKSAKKSKKKGKK